jgi:hypothetical protein
VLSLTLFPLEPDLARRKLVVLHVEAGLIGGHHIFYYK